MSFRGMPITAYQFQFRYLMLNLRNIELLISLIIITQLYKTYINNAIHRIWYNLYIFT